MKLLSKGPTFPKKNWGRQSRQACNKPSLLKKAKRMETQFTSKDKRWIQKTIRKKYSKAAKNPGGLFRYPTGHEGLTTLKYDPELLRALPAEVVASYCGVGNPFTLGPIDEGDDVLDVGCGAGVDALFSAMMTGPSGKVVGID